MRAMTKDDRAVTNQANAPAMARTVTVLERTREAANMFLKTLNRGSTHPPATASAKTPSAVAVPPTMLGSTAWQPLSPPTSSVLKAADSKTVPVNPRPGASHALARANTISCIAARSTVPGVPLSALPASLNASNLHRTQTTSTSASEDVVYAGRTVMSPSVSSPLAPLQRSNTETDASKLSRESSTIPSPHLLRSKTSTGAMSFVSALSTPLSQRGTPRVLRDNRTVSLGGLVRTQSRTASAAPKKVESRGLLTTHEESDERGASVPPPMVRAKEQVAVHMSSLNPLAKEWFPLGPQPVATYQAQVAESRPAEAKANVAQVEARRSMGRQLLKMALRGGTQHQLRIIVGGLMGSGKSTICRMLAELLGGTWVNQDEFSHKGKGAKRAFLAEITRAAADKSVPVLLVDKINTMKQHRREILEAMESGVVGDTILIQMRHPEDSPERFDKAIKLCLSRIQGRGEGHRTLKPSDPKLDIGKILRQTVSGVEPMDADELARFSAYYTADMTLSPPDMVQRILSDLNEADFLWSFPVEELLSQQRLEQAFQISTDAEAKMAGGSKPKAAPANPKGGARRGNGSSTSPDSRSPDGKGRGKSNKPPPLWIWVLELDPASCEALRNLSQRCHNDWGPKMAPVEEYHITLLYVGGGSDAEIASRHTSLKGPEDVQWLREELAKREGTDLEVQLQDIVWDDRLAAAAVTLPLSGLCANLHPHVTLALAPGIAPRVSNELLARRAANDSIKTGLRPWLEQLGLHQYEAQALNWCIAMGAASTEEIAENAADVAAAVEQVDPEQRNRVEAIFSRAAPGELHFMAPDAAVSLRGRVVGWRRGHKP